MGELLSRLSVLVRGNFQLSDFHEFFSVLPLVMLRQLETQKKMYNQTKL